jgi:hypothetical protein
VAGTPAGVRSLFGFSGGGRPQRARPPANVLARLRLAIQEEGLQLRLGGPPGIDKPFSKVSFRMAEGAELLAATAC